MRADILRTYKIVHTWAGIVSGLALFIAFYAGALTVFKEPIARWVTPPAAAPLATAMERAPELIQAVLAAHPAAANDLLLHLQTNEQNPARVSWTERAGKNGAGGGGGGHGAATTERRFRAGLNDDGSLRVEPVAPSALPDFLDTLHRVVGLPDDNDGNRAVMGVIACLYSLALVSGVIVLLPSLVKDFFALRFGKNLKRMWLDVHNVLGIMSLPFHIVMALTAVVFAFHDGIFEVQDRLVHGGRLESYWRGGTAPAAPARALADLMAPAQLLASVANIAPAFEPRTLQFGQLRGPRPSVRVWGFDPQDIARSSRGGFVSLDPYTGKVQSADLLPGRQPAAAATLTSFFALHFATFGGAAVRWIYFALGLVGAFLFYSGNLLWVESRRKTARGAAHAPAQKRSARLLAALTVGVCTGCIGGISFTMVMGRWLSGHVQDLPAWHVGAYYLVFFSAVGWAFARGAARAGPELFHAAALFTALIPLTSLCAVLVPATRLWASSSGAALGVDVVALLGALVLMLFGQAAARRARTAPTDSVWHAASAQNPVLAGR